MKHLLHKLFQVTSLLIIFCMVSFLATYIRLSFAATPSPGHPWNEIGNGIFAATGTAAYRTFTFPDASSTVLTTNQAVTVAQGGTGVTSTSSAMNSFSSLTTKGDLFVRGVSLIERFSVGSNNQVLMASSSKSSGVVWSLPSIAPSGADTQIQFNDGGVFGATTSLLYNKITQTLLLQGKFDLTTQADPTATTTDTLSVYAKKISGRTMLKGLAPSGVSYAYQPSFFQNAIFILSTGAGTALTITGNAASSTGTISHVVSEPLGYMANQVTAALATGVAGTFADKAQFYRGTQTGANGFFFQARMNFPTATSSTYRVFVGLTSGAGALSVASDNPAGSNVAFQYSTGRADTGFKFMTSDGTTQNVSATLMPISVNDVYDFFIYCPPFPGNGTIYYRIDDLTLGTSVEGQTSLNLPLDGTALRPGYFLGNITGATARNIRLSRLYVEADK